MKRWKEILLIVFAFTLGCNNFSQEVAKYDKKENRALVVGFGYQSMPKWELENTVNDAMDVASTLREIEFDVKLLIDPDMQQLKDSINQLVAKESGGVRLFYYAGHGFQIEGGNHLVVDFTNNGNPRTVRLEDIVARIGDADYSSLFFFDACRNSPAGSGLKVEVAEVAQRGGKTVFDGFRIVERRVSESVGLSETNAKAENTFIMYSTAPNEVAYDGDGRNSPFAKALMNNIRNNNSSLDTLANSIARDTRKYTGGVQSPWVSENIFTEIYLKPRSARKVAG